MAATARDLHTNCVKNLLYGANYRNVLYIILYNVFFYVLNEISIFSNSCNIYNLIGVSIMLFNATLNNISVISWQSVI